MNSRKLLCPLLFLLTAALLFLYATGRIFTDAAAQNAVDYSVGLKDDGFYKKVRALDYVTLPTNYASLTIPAEQKQVSPDDVQAQLDAILAYFPESIYVTDRAVVEGDAVNIDYVGSVDGVPFDGGSTHGAGATVIAGATNYIDDFLSQIIGVMPGETIDVHVTFPAEYPVNPDLAGKDAVFVTTVNYIDGGTRSPELSDEFVQENLSDVLGCESVAQLRGMIEEDLRLSQVREFVLNYLFSAECPTIPETIHADQRSLLAQEAAASAAQNGKDVDALLAASGFDSMDAYLDLCEDALQDTIRNYLILQAAAEDLGITVSSEDLAAYFGTEDYSEYIRLYGEGYVRQHILGEKVCDYLVASAV